ncbi:Na+/H+ antiporter NhaC family protein [Sphingosinicella rhizophila]|uniref:Na+/H+ antiporter NhaC family protein n=1 Tax=Sphingosinicella rhizophila TaxID=3050082 RepID=A0ABU3Q5H4_9SPHN|nr:Na+/H+ antiporter NhaC family protein [Sphingosinicella sp. GR2756]MDT9598657.1 Na+/H+ antiporter NhaC family protein [Sphingosinicella sp. GR2756]
MGTDFGAWSLVPPLVAVTLALKTRRVLISLLGGVTVAMLILLHTQPWMTPFAVLDRATAVASDPGNLQLIAFSMLIGSLLQLIRAGRGFDAFNTLIQRRVGLASKRLTFGMTYGFGVALFLETWSNVLITGSTLSGLYDRLGISRERMAYFIHTVAINAVALIVINSWGAYYIGLLRAQDIANPLGFVISAVPYTLYCWVSLALVAFVMASGFTIGPMRESTPRPVDEEEMHDDMDAACPSVRPRLIYLIVPVITLIAVVIGTMWVTGDGHIAGGDGTRAGLYGVGLSILVAVMVLKAGGAMTILAAEDHIVEGLRKFLDVSLLLIFALSLGTLCRDLGTGLYLSQIVQVTLPPFVIPALIFIVSACMSFATGTSYGTLAIMVPIVVPMAELTGLSAPLLFGAALSGSVFGNNTSPIADISIVTSKAADISVVDHVRTQLPYALIAATITVIGFLVLALATR